MSVNRNPAVRAPNEHPRYLAHLDTPPSTSLGWVKKWVTGEMPKAFNDSFSFIHVEDCAMQHVLAMERPEIKGRFMSLYAQAITKEECESEEGKALHLKVYESGMVGRSLHWNEILGLAKKLYPAMPDFTPVTENLARPTHFDLTRENMIIPIAEMKDFNQIFTACIEDLQRRKMIQ